MPTTEQPPIDGRLPLVTTSVRAARWIAGLVVTLLVAEIAARGVMTVSPPEIRWYDAAAQQRIGMLDAQDVDHDVVFAGTSAAWQAFVPEVFVDADGRTAVNAGLAGAIPTVMGRWLVEEIVPRTSPDLVVWGLTPLDFAPNYGSEQESAYASAIETADGRLAELDRTVSKVSTLVAARRVLRDPSAVFGSAGHQRRRDLNEAIATTGPGGERIDERVDLGPEREAIQRARLADFAIDADDRSAVVDTIEALSERGIRVVLVELPLPDRLIDTLPDPVADIAAVRRTIGEIGVETSSDVVFMRDALGDSNFVDFIHLDRAAAATTTAWLAQALRDPGDGCRTVPVADGFGFERPIVVCSNR